MTSSATVTDRSAPAPAVEAEPATAEADSVQSSDAATPSDDLVLADMLIEEISIDGMCGVY